MTEPASGPLRRGPGRVTLLLGLVLALLAGCSGGTAPTVGQQAPAFTLRTLSGAPLSLNSLRGRPVLLLFWKAGCCAALLPELAARYRRTTPQALEIIAVNVGESEEAVRQTAGSLGLAFPVVADPHALLARQYQVTGVPTLFLVDRTGVVRERLLGAPAPGTLARLLARLP